MPIGALFKDGLPIQPQLQRATSSLVSPVPGAATRGVQLKGITGITGLFILPSKSHMVRSYYVLPPCSVLGSLSCQKRHPSPIWHCQDSPLASRSPWKVFARRWPVHICTLPYL